MKIKLCFAALSFTAAISALAAPSAGNADVSDVTLNGHAADGIAFSTGNGQTGANGNPNVFDSVFTGSWNLLSKVDSSSLISSLGTSGLFSSMSWVLNPDGKSGTWSIRAAQDMVTDLVLGIYAGGATTSFLFNDEHLSAGAGNTGTFKIDWSDDSGNVPNFSNATFFYHDLTPSGPSTPPIVSSVPEPEIYAMMLGGLGLFGLMARRKKGAAIGSAGSTLSA